MPKTARQNNGENAHINRAGYPKAEEGGRLQSGRQLPGAHPHGESHLGEDNIRPLAENDIQIKSRAALFSGAPTARNDLLRRFTGLRAPVARLPCATVRRPVGAGFGYETFGGGVAVAAV